jgi:hypothetical protein
MAEKIGLRSEVLGMARDHDIGIIEGLGLPDADLEIGNEYPAGTAPELRLQVKSAVHGDPVVGHTRPDHRIDAARDVLALDRAYLFGLEIVLGRYPDGFLQGAHRRS